MYMFKCYSIIVWIIIYYIPPPRKTKKNTHKKNPTKQNPKKPKTENVQARFLFSIIRYFTMITNVMIHLHVTCLYYEHLVHVDISSVACTNFNQVKQLRCVVTLCGALVVVFVVTFFMLRIRNLDFQ